MTNTILVNKNNPIKESFYQKINLIKIKDIDDEETLIEENTYLAYQNLQEALKKENIEIGIESVFREIAYQEELKNRLFIEKGEDYVKKYVTEPGCSEHHTGLAIDIAIKKDGICQDNPSIEDYQKIHSVLHKFGFILRYPEGKEDITGYSYEPWHIRYVGKIPAKIIAENNLTLEEYINNFGCILYINKPQGITSFDVVHEIKKLFGLKKVGHTGTLDPIATGVMLVAVGKATKIVELLTAEDKEYITKVELGIKTDTYDITGKVLETKEVSENINIEKTLSTFKKTYLQEVPIYSAVKVNGQKLYDYARKEKEVTLPKKEVTIKEIELLEENKNKFTFRALVSKGCYIRSLIMDISKELNTYGTMSSLIRTKQGKITLEETNTLEDIKNNHFQVHKLEEVLNFQTVIPSKEEERLLIHGVKIEDRWNISDKVIFKTNKNQLIGIYEKEGKYLKTWKNF